MDSDNRTDELGILHLRIHTLESENRRLSSENEAMRRQVRDLKAASTSQQSGFRNRPGNPTQ